MQSLPGCRVRLYQGLRHGGNGELRRLVTALKPGEVDRLVIIARWNSHAVTAWVMRVCRHRGIPVEMWKRHREPHFLAGRLVAA